MKLLVTDESHYCKNQLVISSAAHLGTMAMNLGRSMMVIAAKCGGDGGGCGGAELMYLLLSFYLCYNNVWFVNIS